MGTFLASATQDGRRCARCREIRPLAQFRRAKSGTEWRQTECNDCHNKYRRMKRLQQRHRDAYRFAAEVNRRTMDRATLAVLVKEMLSRFNGITQFADDWYDAIQSASQAGRHKAVLTSMGAIMNLMTAAEQPVEPPAKPVEELSDEDLQAELRPLIEAVLAESGETDFDGPAVTP